MSMNAVLAAFVLRGSRGLTRSRYLYALNVRGNLAVSLTPFRLFLKGAVSILRIVVKTTTLSLRKARRNCPAGESRKVSRPVKALIQRVTGASVSIAGEVVGEIGRGLVVFVGVAAGDSEKDVQYLAQKIANLRIFADEASKFNLSALDVEGELLVVSQFTLLADTRKGRRPSFVDAAPPAQADGLFERFVQEARATGLKVETGRFQQYMQVEIHNDGPVSIILDSREKF